MKAITDFLTNLFTTTSDGVSPGIATTEFITLVVSNVVVLLGLNLAPDRKAALIVLLGVAYVVGRSVVKAIAASKPPAPSAPPSPKP